MTVRLLANENFPIPAVLRLRAQGLDVLAIKEMHPGFSDSQVMALAVRERRWVVTFDRDYGELVFGRGRVPPPAIILLREPHYRPSEPADWIIELSLTPERFEGHFVVFRRRGVRTRPMRTVR